MSFLSIGKQESGAVDATIINTGSELLLGRTLNTHGHYLANALWPLDIEVKRQVTLPDGDVIGDELRRGLDDSEVVIVTGGLGPTSDDITRDVIARVLDVPLVHHQEIEDELREYMSSRGHEYRPEQTRQAMVPQGGIPISNPFGTAPGLFFPPDVLAEFTCLALVVLPGPPRELQPMVEAQVVPMLQKVLRSGDVVKVADFRLVGIGESKVTTVVEPQLLEIEGLRFGYCARNSEVDVRCIGDQAVLDRARQVVTDSLGEYLISENGDGLAKVVVDGFREKRLTMVTAESCTGGAIASAITDVSGASDVLRGGFVTYSNVAKRCDLGVRGETLDKHGAVSKEVCAEMVRGALHRSDARIAVACTGIAGPTGGSDEKPVGTVFIGVGMRGADDSLRVERFVFKTDRKTFKDRVVLTALDMIRRSFVK